MKPSDFASARCPVGCRFRRLGGLSLLFLGVVLLAGKTAWAQATPSAETTPPPTTYLVVRHAEREGEADALSEAGQSRAEQLKTLGQLLQVTAIYSTDYRRTKDTAAPLAESLGIEPRIYKEITPQWLAELRTANRGGVVLIVGHSNTIGPIASQLADSPVAVIQSTEYDNLFVISEQATARSLVRLRFGSSRQGQALPAEKMGPSPLITGQPKQGG